MSFENLDSRALLAIVGILILIFTVFRIGRRRRLAIIASQEASPEATPKPSAARSSATVNSRETRQDLEQILVQIQEVAREVEARLDTRIRYARRLIDESEKVLERLDRRLDETKKQPDSASISRVSAAAAYQSNPAVTAQTPSPEPNAPAQAPMTKPKAKTKGLPKSRVEAKDNDLERIGRLAARGMTPERIADELQRPVGEVELMLGLHRQANAGKSA